MSVEIARVESLGWQAPPNDEFGVRWLQSEIAAVSYPRGVLNRLATAGGEGFWLDARARAVAPFLVEASVPAIWDVGAGSGAMAQRLKPYVSEVVSVEPLPEGALEIAGLGEEVFCCTLQDLALPSGSLPAVGLFDVVEHLDDPSDLLDEVARVVSPRGFVFVTVPANDWLWSAEDEALGHYRRYSRAGIARTLSASGLQPLICRYLFASLVAPAALLRTLPYRIGVGRDGSEVLARNAALLQPPAFVNRLADVILGAERGLAEYVALPIGLSVMAVARRSPRSSRAV